MIIQHNIMSLNAHRQLSGNTNQVSKNLEKLSSGYRVNRAGDDAAGLAISEKMRSQIKSLDRAKMNAQDGISLVQTAEGALTETHSMLNRLVDLATESANGTIQADDRGKIQAEVVALTGEIDRIASATNFNGISLLSGTMGGVVNTNTAGGGIAAGGFEIVGGSFTNTTGATTLKATAADATQAGVTLTLENYNGAAQSGGVTFVLDRSAGTNTDGTVTYRAVVDKATATAAEADAFSGVTVNIKHGTLAAGNATSTIAAGAAGGGLRMQVGETADTFNKVTVSIGNMGTGGLGLTTLNLGTQDSAAAALQTIKSAVETVSVARGTLGALQNRLEHTINNLGVTSENMTAAESRIRDVDMAKEMMDFTKNNVLSQAAQAMLAQANQQPQQVLQLLR